MKALGPAEALHASWKLFRARPAWTFALGLSLLVSLLGVCCGLGVFAAPWFLCELWATQIGTETGTTPPRTRAWFGAAIVEFVGVIMFGAITLLAVLAMGPDGLIGEGSLHSTTLLHALAQSLLMLAVVSILALALTVHFQHAHAILIDRGGSFVSALVESARLVAETGLIRTLATSSASHTLQLSPLVVAVALALRFGTLRSTVIVGVALLPLVALCVVLGQGMLVASYLALREQVTDPSLAPPEAEPSRSGAALWATLLGLVLAGPLLWTASLMRPAPVAEGELPPTPQLLIDRAVTPSPQKVFIPDTTLTLVFSEREVSIEASDGGGAHGLPLPPASIEHVRVAHGARNPARSGSMIKNTSAYYIEMRLADQSRHTTRVDDAGVRLDDSLEQRFRSMTSRGSIALMTLCLLWTAVWVRATVPAQGRLRRQLTLRGTTPQGSELARVLKRHALASAAFLLPAALASVWLGLSGR